MPPPAVLPAEMIAIAKDAVKAKHHDAQAGHPTYNRGALTTGQCLPKHVGCLVLISCQI